MPSNSPNGALIKPGCLLTHAAARADTGVASQSASSAAVTTPKLTAQVQTPAADLQVHRFDVVPLPSNSPTAIPPYHQHSLRQEETSGKDIGASAENF